MYFLSEYVLFFILDNCVSITDARTCKQDFNFVAGGTNLSTLYTVGWFPHVL